jgi:hypothetical protein
MIDPAWTPEQGYSHAADLIAILKRNELAREAAANESMHDTNRTEAA